jgi:thioester reductase-like protein
VVWRLWLDLLPVPPSTPQDDFFDLGGDSLTAQKLALALARESGRAVSIRDVVGHPTIARQAVLASGAADGAVTVDRALMDADAALPADIAPPKPANRPALDGGVLLTGATGFVGAQLLHDLLTTTEADVYCLVRADDQAAARDRITANLTAYRLDAAGFTARLHAVPGDLAQPRLGLSPARYQALAGAVDTVLHNAALVNLVRGYAAHRDANVTGTVEILRFAADGAARPVHYVSTLSALPSRPDMAEGPAVEDEVPDGGYGQSKWVAERLLGHAARRGVPVTVYRLGQVMPHSARGMPSRRGLPDLLAKACLQAGMWFTSPIVMNYTPVDCASLLVVTAMRRGETGYFHVRHPQPVAFDDLLAALATKCGLPQVPYPKFWDALRTLAEDETGRRDLQGTLALLPRADEGTEAETAGALAALFRDGTAPCADARTEWLMAEAGLGWPPLDARVFARYAAGQCDAARQPGPVRG